MTHGNGEVGRRDHKDLRSMPSGGVQGGPCAQMESPGHCSERDWSVNGSRERRGSGGLIKPYSESCGRETRKAQNAALTILIGARWR